MLLKINGCVKNIHFIKGSIVFQEGSTDIKGLYLIKKGEFEISKKI